MSRRKRSHAGVAACSLSLILTSIPAFPMPVGITTARLRPQLAAPDAPSLPDLSGLPDAQLNDVAGNLAAEVLQSGGVEAIAPARADFLAAQLNRILEVRDRLTEPVVNQVRAAYDSISRRAAAQRTAAVAPIERQAERMAAEAEAGAPDEEALAPGTRIDGYTVLEKLGSGGMSRVYQVVDNELNRYALKLALGAAGPGPEQQEHAQLAQSGVSNEHAVLSLLNTHSVANIPTVGGFLGQYRGLPYLVETLAEGRALDALLKDGGMKAPRIAVVMGRILDTLEAMHSLDPPVIHRDLKPANVFVGPDDQVTLIDFGIARLHKPGQRQDTTLIGTKDFAAPEQFGEQQTDPRSDIYSAGLLLYALASGREPQRDARLDFTGVDPRIEAVIVEAAAKNPEQRYQNTAELRAALEAALAGPETRSLSQRLNLPNLLTLRDPYFWIRDVGRFPNEEEARDFAKFCYNNEGLLNPFPISYRIRRGADGRGLADLMDISRLHPNFSGYLLDLRERFEGMRKQSQGFRQIVTTTYKDSAMARVFFEMEPHRLDDETAPRMRALLQWLMNDSLLSGGILDPIAANFVSAYGRRRQTPGMIADLSLLGEFLGQGPEAAVASLKAATEMLRRREGIVAGSLPQESEPSVPMSFVMRDYVLRAQRTAIDRHSFWNEPSGLLWKNVLADESLRFLKLFDQVLLLEKPQDAGAFLELRLSALGKELKALPQDNAGKTLRALELAREALACGKTLVGQDFPKTALNETGLDKVLIGLTHSRSAKIRRAAAQLLRDAFQDRLEALKA
ncbi:MAG: serine/threonine protein kinase [Elusimicrobia bacterium]|nr:serine/threonine protein kinase [Elusimicrobiota bacterium]MDE2424978.1 serine/threonine protein kinase [Elusimicrobiota bacterium]